MDGVVDLPLEPDRERKAHVLLAASELYVARGYHDAGEARIFEGFASDGCEGQLCGAPHQRGPVR